MSEQNRVFDADGGFTPCDAPLAAARPLTDFAVEQVGDDLVIFDPETMHYHTLNETAVKIWLACDGNTSAQQIATALGLPLEIVEASVAELGEGSLLQGPATRWDATMSRRRAAKLVAAGLAGMVGVPVVASITAPDALAAVSRGQCLGGVVVQNPVWCGLCALACLIAGSGAGGTCSDVTGGGWCCTCANGVRPASSDFQAAERSASSGGRRTSSYDDTQSSGGSRRTTSNQQADEQPTEIAPEQPVETAPEQPVETAPEQPVEDVAPAPEDSAPEQPVETSTASDESAAPAGNGDDSVQDAGSSSDDPGTPVG